MSKINGLNLNIQTDAIIELDNQTSINQTEANSDDVSPV